MSDLDPHDFESGPAGERIPLCLRCKPNEGRMPVLLLHGASASSETFRIPGPDPYGGPRCLVDWLHAAGFEPWLLDWRGSREVVDAIPSDRFAELSGVLDFDEAARWDIPGALDEIRRLRPDAPRIGAIGHCMGAGTLAQAIASGAAEREPRLSHVVLLTLGLFYEPPLDSRLKTQDRVLDRMLLDSREGLVDPRQPLEEWPRELEEMYRNWPSPLRPHPAEGSSPVSELCDRLSFMYGTPYLEGNLVPEIHSDVQTVVFRSGEYAPLPGDTIEASAGSAGTLLELELESGSWKGGDAGGVLTLTGSSGRFEPGGPLRIGKRIFARCTHSIARGAELPRQFGAIPLRMYAHGAQNVRRRWAAGFGDDTRSLELTGRGCRDRFDRLEAVTLITGEKNQLWHRDSIDRMYEWLTRGATRPGRYRKWIAPAYGHQDLLWGKKAPVDVFPEIRKGLPPA